MSINNYDDIADLYDIYVPVALTLQSYRDLTGAVIIPPYASSLFWPRGSIQGA
jgi:hypothetical protein